MNGSAKRRKRKRVELFYSIDVLTDGSEGTGEGTLFLSVWKHKDDIFETAPLVRYALNGLGDLTSRLAADQKLKLGCVSGIFCSSLASLWGLPALLLALNKSGAANLSVISRYSDRVENIVNLLQSKRTYPTVSICQIQESSDDWWKVFEDEFVTTFAMLRDPNENPMYLIIINELLKGVLVLPRGAKYLDVSLPEVDGKTTKIEWKLAVNQAAPEGISSCYWTESCRNDPGLLVRARHQAVSWHESLPEFFPWRFDDDQSPTKTGLRLNSSYSLWLDSLEVFSRFPEVKACAMRDQSPAQVLGFLKSEQQHSNTDVNEISLCDSDDSSQRGADDNGLPFWHVLGTGCASPSAFRGASGYVLKWPDSAIVVEAGEGFVTQWYRHVSDSLSSIRVIWISHAHFDHYGGLVPLLNAMDLQGTNGRVVVVAPNKVLKYMSFAWDGVSSVIGIPCDSYSRVSQCIREREPRVAFWNNFKVRHSCPAFGFICGLKRSNGSRFSLAFSGDTIPCAELVHACSRVDLLVHEATFADDESETALRKQHSTVGQALSVGRKVDTKRLLLTHFSQRYVDPCPYGLTTHDAACAMDGMCVRLE